MPTEAAEAEASSPTEIGVSSTDVDAVSELSPPSGDERPPRMGRWEALGLVATLLLGPTLAVWLFPVDLRRVMRDLIDAVVVEVNRDWPSSAPTGASGADATAWPPTTPRVVLVADRSLLHAGEDLRVARAIGLRDATTARLLASSDAALASAAACQADGSRRTCIVVALHQSELLCEARVTHGLAYDPDGHPIRSARAACFLPRITFARSLHAGIVIAAALIGRSLALSRHRRTVRIDYERSAAAVARATQTAESVLESPLDDRSRVPQRLAAVERSLVELPHYRATLPLRARLLAERRLLTAVMRGADPVAPRPATPPRALVSLHIVGTPFAYWPPDDQDVIRVGRHRSNDLVVRASTDPESLKVSRTHLVIRRLPSRCIVTDESTNGTRLRGERLTAHVETLLEPGDTLELGGAVTLEFNERAEARPVRAAGAVRVERGGEGAPAPVDFEASVGSLVTMADAGQEG